MTYDIDVLLRWVQDLGRAAGVVITPEHVQQLGSEDTLVSIGYTHKTATQITTCKLDRVALFPSKKWAEPPQGVAYPAEERTNWLYDAPIYPVFCCFSTTTAAEGQAATTTPSFIVILPAAEPPATARSWESDAVIARDELYKLDLSKLHATQVIRVASPRFAVAAVKLANGAWSLGTNRIDESLHWLRKILRLTQPDLKREWLQESFGFVGNALTCEEINMIIRGAICHLNYLRGAQRR